MSIRTIFFDLDDTLYNSQSGLWQLLQARIEQYMQEVVGLPPRQVAAIRQQYLADHGTTLRGLHTHHNIDPEHYLSYVHDVPIEQILSPNPALEALLTRLPQRKWIFTNASQAHARRVIAALGLGPHFAGILDIAGMSYRNKPEPSAYTLALELASEESAAHSLFIDDRAENLAPAKALGATTVLVGTREPHPAAHHSIPRIEALLEAVPGLVE
ncbi:MAG: pyrimidine 5'-nucleotidase [Chloroflexi bacterium]|nr:pyrimidine 5'-nucleotidase [Chloroflexota bacterium]MQC26756.1 pyrimidine 5'-nucleotidase [Chloroflexota bacterium]